MEATIHKVKLTKEGTVKASYSYFDADEARVETEATHHRSVQARQKKSDTIEDLFDTGDLYAAECFQTYTCNQVILPASGGIMFAGGKQLMSGKVLNIITPLHHLDPDLESYAYLDQLNQDLVYFLDEAQAYLDGKSSAGKQLDMFEQPAKEAQVILLQAHEPKQIGHRAQRLIGG